MSAMWRLVFFGIWFVIVGAPGGTDVPHRGVV